MNYKSFLFLLVSLSICLNSFAMDLEESKLFIKSDSLILNKTGQSATFKGNVVVYFEDIQLQTSELIVYYTESHPEHTKSHADKFSGSKSNSKKNITQLIIPTNLVAIRERENEIVMADQGDYDIPSGKLTLNGNVKMQRNDNILVTEKLLYFTKPKTPDKKNNAK